MGNSEILYWDQKVLSSGEIRQDTDVSEPWFELVGTDFDREESVRFF